MKRNLFAKLLSLVLAVVIVATSIRLDAYADNLQGTEELYIKSVKLATSDNASDARAELEAEGYIFLDQNLNKGTGQKGVYLGYTTTADPKEAIYDMKLMNMKGGFTRTSMEKAIEQQKTSFTQMAVDLNMLLEEFREAYDAGTVPAEKAYKALNFFSMTDRGGAAISENDGLGYYIVKEKISIDDLTEIILFCDLSLVDSIVKILTMGISGKNENWIKELSELGPYDSEYDYGMDDAELKRRAEQLLPILQLYVQSYNTMEATGIVSGEFDDQYEIQNAELTLDYTIEAEDSDIKNMDLERHKSYKIAFDELEKYSYGEETMKDFFCGLEDSSNTKCLYPLVSVLSDGEFSAFSYGCVLEMIIGADANDEAYNQYDEIYDKSTEEVKSVYLYGGVDKALIEDDTIVAFTEETNRHMAATGELEFYENETDAEDTWENGKQVATILAASGMIMLGVAKLTIFTAMLVTWTWNAATLAATSGFLGTTMKICLFMNEPFGMLIAMDWAIRAIIVTYIITLYQEWRDGHIDWDENPIPEYIYDVTDVEIKQTSENGDVAASYIKTTKFVFYEVVRDIYGDPVDLNARSKDASQWLCMYVSYDILGESSKPIKASDLKVQYGDGQTPEGYAPLCEFGEVIAKDMNSYDEDNDVNGVYFFYKQNDEISMDSGKTYYVSSVYLQAGESTEHCIGLLEAAGYTPINVNLTPGYKTPEFFEGDDIYTYLGYKTTTNKRQAICDLRFSRETNASPFIYGDLSYAECGSSAGVTLYATKYTAAGSPILAGGLLVTESVLDAPIGYEPVNQFFGGPALGINNDNGYLPVMETNCFLYFLPEKAFTEGEQYISGISYFCCDLDDRLRMMSDYEDTIYDTLLEETGEDYRTSELTTSEIVSLYLRIIFGYDESVKSELADTYLYSYTYNPYRAIYDIVGTQSTDTQNNLTWNSCGYVACPTIDFDAHHPGENWTDPNYLINNTSYYGHPDPTGKLFVTGNTNGNTYSESSGEMSKKQPLKVSEFICQDADVDESEVPSEEMGYTSLYDIFAADGGDLTIKNKNELHTYKFYIANRQREELPYISNIYINDRIQIAQMYGGTEAGVTVDLITDGIAMSVLAGQGATNFCSYKADFKGWKADTFATNTALSTINRVFFSCSKTDKSSGALRDLFLYYHGLTSEAPPDTLYRGSVKYNLISKINYNFTGCDEAPAPGVYLYGTTDSDAGGRIVDFTVSDSPFKTGYETVRTMNGRSLYAEVTQSLKDEKSKQPFGKTRDMIEEWINFFSGTMDEANENPCGFYYLHIKREGDSTDTQQYISDLYLAKQTGSKKMMLDSLFDQGAEGYVNKDLNDNAGGAYIYLGYSYTTDASDAITAIRASHSKSHPETKTGDNNIVYYLVDDIDLNDEAGGDYIYLYYTKVNNEYAGTPISAIEASESVKNYTTDTAEVQTMMRWDKWEASDLNDGCGFWSDYIYLLLTRPFECPSEAEFEPDYGKNKTYTRKITEGTEDGQYIGALYVMDKNTIRQERLAAGVDSDDCECSDISDSDVKARLTEMGATTIVETPILMKSDDYWEDNANKVFIGYSRTDTLRYAIKGLAIQVKLLSDGEAEESITANNKTYKLVAEAAAKVEELPSAINLIGMEDAQDNLVPRMYLYTTTSGDTPIYDICVDSSPIKTDWTTVLSQNGVETFLDLSEMAKETASAVENNVLDWSNWDGSAAFTRNEIYALMGDLEDQFAIEDREISPFYIHCKGFAGTSLKEEKPYIGELFVEKGDSKKEAVAKLLAHEPDGYLDRDLNDDAGGDYVYLAYKRVDNASTKTKAITDIVIYQGEDKEKTRRITNSAGESIKYELVADVDLNSNAGGKYLYLYTTTDEDANEEPIRDIWISVDDIINRKTDCIMETTVVRADGSSYTEEYIDLNKGAGGEYLYLIMKREDHNPRTNVVENLVSATCGEGGSYDSVECCSLCGKELYRETIETPATGEHTAGEPVEEGRIEPTADTDGSYQLVVYCTVCGEKLSEETVVLPATGEATTEETTATVTEEGETLEDTSSDEVLEGSIMGSGSVIAICVFAGISILAAIFFIMKKKKEN